jgi:hypothetical protein
VFASFLLALIFADVVAVGFFPLVRRQFPGRLLTFALLLTLILLSPLWIAPDHPFLRFLAAVNAAWTAAKMFDVFHDLHRGAVVSYREFLAFLLNPFSLVRRRLPTEPRPPVTENFHRILLGSVGAAVGVSVLYELFRWDWSGGPFLLEHSVKVLVFFLTFFAGLEAATALWRLLFGPARAMMDRPYLARTPAEFWRRYNRVVQQFFWEDFYRLSGRRASLRTVLLVFFLSAAMHEYAFTIALGRVQGYQSAFFLLHGLATIATVRLKLRGGLALLGMALTFFFNLLTSVLFFASIQSVVPFYQHGLPAWLPPR